MPCQSSRFEFGRRIESAATGALAGFAPAVEFWRGRGGHDPSGQTDGREDTNCLIVKRLQRGVTAGFERGGLFPHRPLRRPPARTVPDLDLDETGSGESPVKIDASRTVRHPVVVTIDRLPTGQHYSPTRCQDSAQLTVGGIGLVGELDRVNTQDRVNGACVQPRRGQVADAEIRLVPKPVRVVHGLAHRLGGEVDPQQSSPGSGRHLKPVATPTTSEVEQPVAGGQSQDIDNLGDPFPAQQAGRKQMPWQTQVTLRDLVLYRRSDHGRVPAIEVFRGAVGPVPHKIIMASQGEPRIAASAKTFRLGDRISRPMTRIGAGS